MDHSRLKQDYEYCQNIIEQQSKSFYYAFKELPKQDADAVYAVYAFCRMADDIVDEANNQAESLSRLAAFKKALNDFSAGQNIDHPMWRALRDVHDRYELDLTMLHWQIAGQQQDIDFTQPKTLDDLRHYSVRVAGSVGRMLLPILSEHPDEEMKQGAQELGVAMQITNILRDIGEDYNNHQRIYIPVEIIEQYGCIQAIEHGQVNADFIAMWECLAQYAEKIYDQFYPSIRHYKKEAQLPLLLSAVVYRGIIDEVRNNNYDCLTRRNKVSLTKKLMLRQQAKHYLRQED